MLSSAELIELLPRDRGAVAGAIELGVDAALSDAEGGQRLSAIVAVNLGLLVLPPPSFA